MRKKPVTETRLFIPVQGSGFSSRNHGRNTAPSVRDGGQAPSLSTTIKTKDEKFHRGTQVEERRIATHDIAINS